MGWDKQLPQAEELIGYDGGMLVKGMTDQQMEILQKQIAAYTVISEQLVELHKTLSFQNDLTGVRLGSMFYEPCIALGAHKISGRQRWTPTPTQLEILERTFKEEGSISKPKIPELTAKLQQHGQISETNVYNWFQNRRARSKRKQKAITSSSSRGNIEESEAEAEAESSTSKSKAQNLEGRSEAYANEGSSSINAGFGQTSFYDI